MAFEPKLSPEERADVINSDVAARVMAAKYDVSTQTIYNIRQIARKKARQEAGIEEEVRKPRPSDAWAELIYQPQDTTDRLHVPPEIIPDGMCYQWCTVEVLGQPMPQRISWFERQGWRPVPSERHAGRWTSQGTTGPIVIDGLMLYERPQAWTDRARAFEQRAANEIMQIKKLQLTGGEMPGVTLDAGHPSAVRTNRMTSNYERIEVPKE